MAMTEEEKAAKKAKFDSMKNLAVERLVEICGEKTVIAPRMLAPSQAVLTQAQNLLAGRTAGTQTAPATPANNG